MAERRATAVAERRAAGVVERRATGAAVCVLVGAVAATFAVVAGPGPGLTGYVSEAGVADSIYAWTYRLGVLTLGAALLLLAAALRDRSRYDAVPRPARRPDRALRIAVVLLVVGAVATALSGAVTCSDGCPLPPFETPTVADLVHGAASIVAAGATVLAMIAILFSRAAAEPLRRTATICVASALPLAGALGLAMLLVGRGTLAGVLERLLLLVIVGWGVVTAAILATADPGDREKMNS
ncbi:DUF998 domain-containing protein [Verrucosispora sp. ts21]|uniref:DUF998 domain-containing protein n=1 Tax=Verrucosispora sp. ts21 TaxID=2069341 RepID=UPI000C88DBEC|nr:DUF998 domain-containing protein [Verrucosispora sp. ts21]PMR59656.1 DUF998 domain-containing protein [Verrucosispora sp. ts21]